MGCAASKGKASATVEERERLDPQPSSTMCCERRVPVTPAQGLDAEWLAAELAAEGKRAAAKRPASVGAALRKFLEDNAGPSGLLQVPQGRAGSPEVAIICAPAAPVSLLLTALRRFAQEGEGRTCFVWLQGATAPRSSAPSDLSVPDLAAKAALNDASRHVLVLDNDLTALRDEASLWHVMLAQRVAVKELQQFQSDKSAADPASRQAHSQNTSRSQSSGRRPSLSPRVQNAIRNHGTCTALELVLDDECGLLPKLADTVARFELPGQRHKVHKSNSCSTEEAYRPQQTPLSSRHVVPVRHVLLSAVEAFVRRRVGPTASADADAPASALQAKLLYVLGIVHHSKCKFRDAEATLRQALGLLEGVAPQATPSSMASSATTTLPSSLASSRPCGLSPSPPRILTSPLELMLRTASEACSQHGSSEECPRSNSWCSYPVATGGQVATGVHASEECPVGQSASGASTKCEAFAAMEEQVFKARLLFLLAQSLFYQGEGVPQHLGPLGRDWGWSSAVGSCFWIAAAAPQRVCGDGQLSVAPPGRGSSTPVAAGADGAGEGRMDLLREASRLLVRARGLLEGAAPTATVTLWLAEVCEAQGRCHVGLGNARRAFAMHQQALEMRLARLRQGHVLLAQSHYHLGLVQMELKNYDEALARLNLAAQMYDKELGEQHVVIAEVHRCRGCAAREAGDRATAQAALSSALRVFTHIFGPLSLEVADMFHLLAEVAEADEGVEHLEKCLELRAAHLHREHVLVKAAVEALVEARRRRGEEVAAEAFLEEWEGRGGAAAGPGLEPDPKQLPQPQPLPPPAQPSKQLRSEALCT